MMTAGSGTSPQSAASTFIQQANASVQKSDAITVNGLSAQRVLSGVITESDTLAVLSYFIFKDNLIYTLHGMSAPAGYSSYASTFNGVMGQFKNLTDSKRMQVKPTLLSVKSNKTTGTLATALRASGVAEKDLENLAVLNGKKLEDPLKLNSKLKLISN